MSSEYERSAADNSALGIKSIEVGPRTPDEQIQACRYQNFLMSVQEKLEIQEGPLDADAVANLVQRKHYYAGCNAQWTFAMNYKQMKNYLMVRYRSKKNRKSIPYK